MSTRTDGTGALRAEFPGAATPQRPSQLPGSGPASMHTLLALLRELAYRYGLKVSITCDPTLRSATDFDEEDFETCFVGVLPEAAGSATATDSSPDTPPEAGSHRREREQCAEALRDDASAVFGNAAFEELEPGMDSAFGARLCEFVSAKGKQGLEELLALARENPLDEDVAAYLLDWLALLDDEPSRRLRSEFFADMLNAESAHVRLYAVTGIECLGEPAAREPLSNASEREPVPLVKDTMTRVLARMGG